MPKLCASSPYTAWTSSGSVCNLARSSSMSTFSMPDLAERGPAALVFLSEPEVSHGTLHGYRDPTPHPLS